jgi:uncharacterized iron-regulated membrane protein
MRKWHRWLSVIFGVFLLWIALTGVMSQFAAFAVDAEVAPSAAVPPGFVCPETMSCRPKPGPDSARAWESFLHHLHSGESFGPLGTAVSILSGMALLFFSFSGLWLYIQMWRSRKDRGLTPRWWWS